MAAPNNETINPSIELASVPDELDVSQIESVPEPKSLPTQTVDTGEDLLASVNNLSEQRQVEIDRISEQQQRQETTGSALADELRKSLSEQGNKTTALIERQNELGFEQGLKQVSDLNAQIQQQTAALNKGLVNVDGQPIARQFIVGQQAQMRAQAAAEIGALSAAAQAAQGRINIASQLAQRSIEAEFAPKEQRINTLKELINLNYTQLSRTDKKLADKQQQQLDVEKARIEEEKNKRSQIYQIMQDAAKNGADANTLTNIAKSTSPEEALLNSAEVLQTKDYKVIDIGGRKKIIDMNDGGKIVKDLGLSDFDTPKPQKISTDMFGNDVWGVWDAENGGFNPVELPNFSVMDDNELSNALFNSVATLPLSKDQRGAVTKQLQQQLQSGNEELAKDTLMRSVITSQSADIQKKFLEWDAGKKELETIGKMINEYIKDGGKLGVWEGATEKQLQKWLGKTTDPDLAKIQQRISTSIQAYRNAVSGAAFTESEQAEYEAIFPNISNDPELNKAQIEGLKNFFDDRRENYAKSIIGDINWESMFGTTMAQEPLPPLTQTYSSVDNLLQDNPQYLRMIEALREEDPNASEGDMLQAISQISASIPPSFNPPLVKGEKGLEKLTTGQTNLAALGEGTITGFGSDYWKAGLDFVLKGGLGAPVKFAAPLKVLKVASGSVNRTGKPLSKESGKRQNGGFGNQVTVQLPNGYELDVSHLDQVANLKPGQTIPPNLAFATQGNTGMTYGSTGVHLDLTGRDPQGNTLTAKEVAALLGDIRLT